MEPPSLIPRKEEQAYRIPPYQASESRMPAFLKRSLSFMTLDPALKSLPFPPQPILYMSQFSSLQSLSCVQLFATPWTAAHQASLSITNFWSLLKLMSIESVMPSNHLILCRPLLLQPSIIPSIRVFSKELILRIRWPKYWSFSFSINPSNEHSGLISFRKDWMNLLAVQGTLKNLLQHHSSKHQFFGAQFSL